MKFDVVVGNPLITKQKDGKYQVVYAEPPQWKISNYVDLTYEEVLELPFIREEDLRNLKNK